MSKKITAVEWLAEKYNYVTWMRNRDDISAVLADQWRKHYLEQAKELEKQQIEYAETKDIQQLIDRNYAAQIRRGQINDKTKPHNFLTKINEELEEVMQSDTWEEMADEVNDLKMVCESFLYFLHKIGYVSRTPQQIHIDKVDYNEKRED